MDIDVNVRIRLMIEDQKMNKTTNSFQSCFGYHQCTQILNELEQKIFTDIIVNMNIISGLISHRFIHEYCSRIKSNIQAQC